MFSQWKTAASARAVRVGQRNQEEAQGEVGLAEGTQAVRVPNSQMKDGIRVRPLRWRAGPHEEQASGRLESILRPAFTKNNGGLSTCCGR